MQKTKKTPSLKLLYIISSILLFVSIIIFVMLGFSVQYQDLSETYSLAKETTSYLESECAKYDNYTRGNSARSLQDLLDTANGLKKFIPDSRLTDSDFMHTFIHTEHISGIIILDSNLSVLAQADMDDKDSFSLWSDTIAKSDCKSILQHPQKTFINHVTLKKVPYDFAIIATDDASKLILCYTSTEKPSTDPYELNIQGLLTNNSFHKNPTLVIAAGSKVLSTNNTTVDDLGAKQYQKLNSKINWSDKRLAKIRYHKTTWYGLRHVYGDYIIYAAYPSNEVFSNRTDFITWGLMIYLAVCVILLAIQKHFDKVSLNNLEKQLYTINAISTSYSSTFLLHIDTMELEPLNPSKRLNEIFIQHPDPYDFLFTICKTEIAADYYPILMHFLNLDTLGEQLKGKQFLETEVKDKNGAWYSILLIPQETDSSGNIKAFLITTRDITSLKQTEELSYKDKLTGLHNRNYLESRSKHFVRAGDLPVSLIMADCNYLKRTNDTLGHEYGDLLLQRVANIIKESISKNCIAMRVGGDEFLIVCMRCDNNTAHQLIDTIKKKLVEHSDDKLTLSVSFGVSTTESGEFSFEQAYEAADREMYRDKQASRVTRES